jgi:[acyl-carrier-protein] S-malonyltransferase
VTAWLFPGQGTQKVGMGQSLCASSEAAARVFAAADEALGEPFAELVFAGPAERLTQTANAQPAILTASVAALEALRAARPDLPDPRFAAGHSLGEYSALVAAGGLEFADAVRLVRLRGEAMQRAVPAGEGAMAAILGGTPDSVEDLCQAVREQLGPDAVLAPANFNAPGQIVVAGHAPAVALARKLAPERKLKAIVLQVSAPFHCALMAPAAQAVRRALGELRLSPLRFPVVSNVEALPNQDPAAAAELLVRQVDGPVRWQESLEWMAGQGITEALEIGPGKVLAGLARKTAPGLNVQSIFEPEQIDAASKPAEDAS